MSKAKNSPPEEPPAGLSERMVLLAKELGMHWTDAGGGVYRHAPADGTPVWRVYSEWGGQGAIVDVDVVTGEVTRVQEQDFETVGRRLAMPEALRPSEAEALAFLRPKVEKVGWTWPALLIAEWDDDTYVWRVRSEGAAVGQGLGADVRGKRGKLHLARMWRA